MMISTSCGLWKSSGQTETQQTDGTSGQTEIQQTDDDAGKKLSEDGMWEQPAKDKVVSWEELSHKGSMPMRAATEFSVDYIDVYQLVTIADTDRFLLIPEGEPIPVGLPEDVTVLAEPLDRIYLVSSSAMDYFLSLDGLPKIRLSATKEDGWCLEEAAEAMRQGDMLYAGKYSAPDYELLLGEACDLAIENTMIYHTPEVKEQLEKLGIPVLVEYSSYEADPLGRLEWVKLYGLLLGKEEEATALYEKWIAELDPLMEQENTGQTVAFFYITGNGAVNVRKSKDYIAQLIELAGGSYVFEELDGEDENALATINIQMEEFYRTAKDADYLIYNGTVDDELHSLDELLGKSALMADFRAVQEGHVYSTGRDFYQESTGMGRFVQELHAILVGEEPESNYLKQLK